MGLQGREARVSEMAVSEIYRSKRFNTNTLQVTVEETFCFFRCKTIDFIEFK